MGQLLDIADVAVETVVHARPFHVALEVIEKAGRLNEHAKGDELDRIPIAAVLEVLPVMIGGKRRGEYGGGRDFVLWKSGPSGRRKESRTEWIRYSSDIEVVIRTQGTQ